MVSSANPLQIDRDELRRAVKLLIQPGFTYEVRSLSKHENGKPEICSGYFDDRAGLRPKWRESNGTNRTGFTSPRTPSSRIR